MAIWWMYLEWGQIVYAGNVHTQICEVHFSDVIKKPFPFYDE